VEIMALPLRHLRVALILALLGLSVACRAGPAGGPVEPSASPTVVDPALQAAADRTGPMLENDFRETYAGLELDHQARRMIIYRKPDPRLETVVRSQNPGVDIVYRDARFSLAEMRVLVERILADQPYWHTQGIEIRAVGPRTDGNGVIVTLSAKDIPKGAPALKQRYGADRVTVEEGSIVPMPASPWAPRPTPSAT
jgi:hypothetical protein